MINWEKWHKKDKIEKIPKNYFLMELLRKHLPKKGSCIELGCSPGRMMSAMAKNFNYRFSGIDITALDTTKKNLEHNNIRNVKLIKGNITSYRPNQKYDIVCSFGLIEHFKNSKEAFKHFDKFCRKGGYMVIGLPNFRYLFKAVHFLFGRSIYHNPEIMDLSEIRKITKDYETIYLGYYPKLFKFNLLIKSKFTAPYIIYIGRKV